MPPVLDRALVFERDDNFYLVGPVAPFDPADDETAGFKFGADLKSFAPNEMLGWLRGQYVEADRPNENGALWTADELAIKSLTPRLMPVTVMHDPRSAVGMIADTSLLVPATDGVPRARIDTTLGIWRHRFKAEWDEIAENYASGQLMQSMECRPAWYECGECDKRFPRLPGGAERANWCDHLRGETAAAATSKPVRRLGNVTFTGTGLIFGTRGSRGAFDSAHLDVLADEVAEFHAKSAQPTKPKTRTRRKNRMEIDDREYQDLVAAKTERDQLKARNTDLEETAAQVPTLTSEKDALEVRAKKAEDDLAAERTKREGLEETARAETLAKERTDKLGSAFVEALPDGIKSRLDEQAKSLADDKWIERLDELAELVKVAHDKDKEGGGSEDEFTEDEIARSGAGGSGGKSKDKAPEPAAQRTVVGGLLKRLPTPR